MEKAFKFIIIILCLLVSSCARIVTPKGGEKDLIPPKYVSSTPKENSVNFHGNSIEINFNEYIVLDNATGKLIVSPPLKKKPTIGSKLKTLYIKDLDSLQENTTYIFDFGDAITDFTEGNRLSHFSFAFSTGNQIDTLSYKGRLLNAYTLKPEPAKYVALYRNHDRKYIRENIPDYITRADSSGRFYFQNIKEGEYFVLAFDDQNQNMIYDLATEGFGCEPHRQILAAASEDSIMKVKFNTILFNESEDTVQKILSSKIINERELQIITSIPVSDSFDIKFSKPALSEDDFDTLFNKNKDTITLIAKTEKIFDTVKAEITDKKQFKEKLDLTYNIKKKRNKDEKKTFALSLQEKDIAFFDSPTLICPNAINYATNSVLKALIIDNTDTIHTSFAAKSNNPKQLYSDIQLESGKTYILWIDSMQIFDYNGLYNDTLRAELHIDSPDDYGSFVISVQDTAKTYVSAAAGEMPVLLTLFDEKNKQVGEDISADINGKPQIFEFLKEGKYKLRVIIDANGNKKWDKGDFDTAKEPEKVMFFDKTISIRKGWQTVEQWILTQ